LRRFSLIQKKRGFSSERVQKAYDLASRFHEGQKRKSGDPYLTHVLAVTNYLVQYDADEDSLIAGLLHDAVEDTECTIEDIERLFGHSTAVLIDGLTKFSKKTFLMRIIWTVKLSLSENGLRLCRKIFV
jgi:guanosine-3',5'-bis(diphosphate) 3'-pyrophosphohydrolase